MLNEHDLKETLPVEVETPDHAPRQTTELFIKTKKLLLERDGARCWICGKTAEESGHPLEAHHAGIERSFAEGPIDWGVVKLDFPNFDWDSFDPANPYTFVDDMLAQGRIYCKEHHTHPDTGVHTLPWPLFVMQRYLKAGYKFNDLEVIVHELT